MCCNKTKGLIRLAKILKDLEVENHFEADDDTVKTIMDFIHVSKLSNEEIRNEILEIHTLEMLKVRMM